MLTILYQDEYLVAVDKPSGMMVHRTELDRVGREPVLLQLLRDQIGRRVYPVHRLDRGTSGVILFGLDSSIAGAIQDFFKQQKVQKSYIALVRGYTDKEGHIAHAIPRSYNKPKVEAFTDYRTLDSVEIPHAVGRYPTARYSLVEAHPRTGRMHQIRRHFAHLRHPVIGDGRYGDRFHNRFFKEELGCGRLMLHAKALILPHPVTGRDLELTMDLPGDLQDVLKVLKIHP